ncbi:MAG: hypothetical protein SGBAC_010952 [Bacillariaceae sp.]
MEDDNARFAQMSNRSLIREIDEAEAVLDDEIKVILEFEKSANNNNSVYVDESFFEDDDDDDLTGELANLESLTALQQELNMSAISYEEFNANTSRAYALEREEEEEAVITDVGEIQIGDSIMEEEPCATWKPALSLSQDSSIRSVSQQTPEHNLRKQTIHRLVSRDGGEDEDAFLSKQPSNDSEGSSVFRTSSHDNSSAMHLMSQDRLDINIAVSPIRCESEEDAEKKALPVCNQESNIKPVFRRILVDTTPTANAMASSNESEAVTPKIQNTKPVANAVQSRDDNISPIRDENCADHSESKASKNATQQKENETTSRSSLAAPKLSPVSSLLNTLLASPEPVMPLPDIIESPTVFEAEGASDVGLPETSESESSNARESRSFSSQMASTSTSSEVASLSPMSSASTTSASSSASSSSISSAQSKWNPMRLFNQKNSSEVKTRKSILSKSTSKSKKKKSTSKTRQRFNSPLNLPTVSEEKTLPPTQPTPPNIAVSQLHDPSETEIRNTLGMEEDSTSREGKRSSLFQDNKERVAVNRMMKMLMEQRNKNKIQEKRERKLLHMLCDARNDRKDLINGHKKEAADLHRKLKSSFENNEILKQENELLLMQTDAWKEISRQSNQTAALYKYSFCGRQGSPRFEALVGEAIDGRNMETTEADDELVHVKREKEELEDKLKKIQKESHLEMEGLKYQTEFVTEELKTSQALFEDKLQNYIQENIQLKDETNTLRKELEQRNVEVSNAQNEVQDLQKILASKLDAEVTNLRAEKLEDQLASMEEDHKAELACSNRDNTMADARIQNLATSLGTENVERQRAEKDLHSMRDQLSHERKSRSQSTLIFQQRNESLVKENQSLKKEVNNLKAELASTRTDQVQIEAGLMKERKEVYRLEKQSEEEAELINELQEELDSLQCKFDGAESETSSTEKVTKSVQDTLENEIQAAEKIALRVQVERLKLELKSKSPLTPLPSYPSTYKSPVERRVRDQMLRLRKSLTPKEKEEEVFAPPPSPFFTDSTSVTLSGKPKSLKSPTPKKFVRMLRPKAKGPSLQPRRLNKENNTFMSPQKRRGGGLSSRTSLGIR